VMAAGTALQARGEQEKGRAAETAAKIEAAQMERAAKARLASSQREALEIERQGRLQQSRALAAAAASGASASDVGFSNLLADLAGETHYRKMVSLYEGETGAQTMGEQARFTRWGGRRARQAGNLAAASTALKGASSMYSMYGGGGPSDGYGFNNFGDINSGGYGAAVA